MIRYGFFYGYLLFLPFLVAAAVLAFRKWPAPSRSRSVALNLVATFFSFYVLFLLAEAFFYFFYDETDGAMTLLSSQRWVERHVNLNELGYRDKPLAERGDAELTIAVLGDSYAFGHGIALTENRWPDLLEQKLRGSGIRAEIYNLSWPGWGTNAELRALRSLPILRKLDVVLLAYVPNDHDDLFRYGPDYVAAVASAREPPPMLALILKRSFVFDFLYTRSLVFRHPTFRNYDGLMLEKYRDARVWRNHLASLRALQRLCQAHSIRLFVVTFPLFSRPWDQYALEPVHRRLTNFWRSRGIASLDLLDHYRSVPANKLVVNRFDSHPNELAHRIATEQVFDAFFGGATE